MKLTFKLVYAMIAGMGLSFAAASTASAATVCSSGNPVDVTGYVTASVGSVDGCLLTTIANDDASNVDGLFGVADWQSSGGTIDKIETPNPGTSGFLTIADDPAAGSTAVSGLWTIAAGFFDVYETALLIFKDGNGADPATVIGFQISGNNVSGASGTYTTMFYNAGTTTLKSDGVSHVTLYGGMCPAGDTTCGPVGGTIPLPAGLPLLLSAIGIGGLLARRKRKAA